MRPYVLLPVVRAAAVIALAVIALAVVTGGDVRAAIIPDSQARICPAALDRLSSSADDLADSHTIGSMMPLFFLGVASRPDEWVIEYERRVAFLAAAIGFALEECPNFAPFSGPSPGHLRLSTTDLPGRSPG